MHNQAMQKQDMMRSNGKIYVVVAVVVTILLACFFICLTWTGRSVSLKRSDSREASGVRKNILTPDVDSRMPE
jgi:flagellar basal body-associated protein FliL